MKESWKTIKEFNGRFKVSESGKVWDEKERRILKTTRKNGTKEVFLCVPIDELVASAFIENPNGYNNVCHINGDSTNDNAYNLKWVEDEVKKNHARDNDYVVAKFDMENNYVESFKNATEASKSLGVSHSSIVNCLNGKRKSAYRFKWRYVAKSKI